MNTPDKPNASSAWYNRDWKRCADVLPPLDVVVETKLEDEHGCRNTQKLRRSNGLWFTPDKIIYVYYTPTHWRELA